MDIKITSERDNPLLERRDVEFVVLYDRTAPARKEVVAKLASDMNSKEDLVVIEKMMTEFGNRKLRCHAKIYRNETSLKATEYDYILERGKSGKVKTAKPETEKPEVQESEPAPEKNAKTENETEEVKTEPAPLS